MKAKLITVWDGGVQISADAEYDKKTGYIAVEKAVDINGLDNLEDEYLLLSNGDEIPVCRNCHEYTMKLVVIPNEHCPTVLDEVFVCQGKCDEEPSTL